MAPHSSVPLEEIARLRAAIVAGGRRLGARGLISASEGNISARLADGSLVIMPSGRRKDELDPDEILRVPFDPEEPAQAGGAPGGTADPKPSSDIAIHRAVYAARADLRAVVHAHLPAAMALTLAGEVPDPAALPETALFLPRLPLVPFATPGSAELAALVVAAFTSGEVPLPGAVLLERHGAVAVGETVDQAVNRLELVEVLCRTWRDALLIRGAVASAGARAILRPSSPSPGTPARGRTQKSS